MGDQRISSSNAGLPSPSGDASRFYDLAPACALVEKHTALQYPYRCRFGQAQLEIDWGVFCPTLTNVSPLLLDAIEFRTGARVLDAFCGSGAFGVNAALFGATRVVAIDISPQAVACTRKNARLNQVERIVEVREGTISECVLEAETFDLVIANPPLLPGDQTGALGQALFDPGMHATLSFIRELKHYLAADGCCYFLSSDVIERYGYDIDRLCVDASLLSAVVAKVDVVYETYRVHKITHM